MESAKTPDQKLVQKYIAKYDACARARQPFEREWFNNLAFFAGKHYIRWTRSVNNSGTSAIIPPAPAWRVRLVSNRIKTIVRKEVAKLNREKPMFYVIPASPEDEDLAKARAAEAVGEYLLVDTPYTKRRREQIWWASTTGTGIIKCCAKGEEIHFETPTPFHIWVPNLEETYIQEQPYVIHGVALTPDEVKGLYGVDLEPNASAGTPEQKFLQGIGINKDEKDLQTCFLKEFWVKPNQEFPDGAMFVIGGTDQLVWMQEGIPEFELDPATGEPIKDPEGKPIPKETLPSNILGGSEPRSVFPYRHGRYPFSKIESIFTGKFYGESVIVDLIPLQKEYNRSRSQAIEARNLTGKPQWVGPKGAVDYKKITAEPGLFIEYTPGFDKPEPVKNPELPSYFMQDQQANLNDMDFISNMYEVTQGRTPPGVEAASAIAYLQEESDSIYAPTVDSIEESVQDIGFQAIELARQYWPDGKIVKVMSGTDVYETFQFKHNTLPDQLDFRIEKGSMAPKSRAGRQAFLMELADKGLIPPMLLLKYLDMNNVSGLYNELKIDINHAERENFKMKTTGQPVMINEFDNDEIHVHIHAKYMKSQTYETLPEEIKMAMLQHYQMHMLRIGRVELNGRTEPESGTSGEQSSNGEYAQSG